MSARDDILARARVSATAPPRGEPVPGARFPDREAMLARFVDRLLDYRAEVTRCTAATAPDAIAAALAGAETVAVPADLPTVWLSAFPGRAVAEPEVAVLDSVDAVLTGCAVAVAETGTIILDAGEAQGPRALTLVPDRYVCVVRASQVRPDVPDAVAELTATRPLTWISGPSATSDIELKRVEGVHGPRRLHVIVLDDDPTP